MLGQRDGTGDPRRHEPGLSGLRADHRSNTATRSNPQLEKQPPPPDRVHARVSKIRFPSLGNPVVVESFSRSVGIPTWEYIRCGSEQSAGTVSLRYAGGKVYCSFHCGQRFDWNTDFKVEPNRPQFRRLPRYRLYFKPGEDWSNFQDVPIFDMLFLEWGAEPFGNEELQPSEILKMAAASFENDTLLKMAFFKWMEVRPHADLRPLLISICQMQDDHGTGIDAATLLVKRNELSAFREMIPSLLDVQKGMLPTPIMDVFRALADHPKTAAVMKQAWAAEIIRTHLNGPLGEWKAMSIMKVAVRLSGESFGFEKQKSGEANMAAFQRAQKWAWKNR